MTFADLDGDELWSYLQERSGLPGPRANLGLMLEFARGADDDDILQAAESEDEIHPLLWDRRARIHPCSFTRQGCSEQSDGGNHQCVVACT